MDFVIGTVILAAVFLGAGYLVRNFPVGKKRNAIHWYRGRKR